MAILRKKLRAHSAISYFFSTVLVTICIVNSPPAFSEFLNAADMKHGEMKHSETTHANISGTKNREEHGHQAIDVANWPATPSLTLTAYKDLVSGWNLHIVPKHFKFAPNNVNTPSRPGEGHAHLYINGEKMTRLYAQWYYLNNLAPGKHTITISLNANDHGPLEINGEPIETTIELVQE